MLHRCRLTVRSDEGIRIRSPVRTLAYFEELLLIFSYGIKAAYSETFASTYFQAAIEDMDHWTAKFNIPVKPTKLSSRSEKRRAEYNLKEIDPDHDRLDDLFVDYVARPQSRLRIDVSGDYREGSATAVGLRR